MADDIKKDEVTKTAPPSDDEKMVSVPLEFVQKATKLIEQIPELNKQIERLTAAADKSQLANYDMRHQGKIVQTVLVNFYENKLITAWRMIRDNVAKINGVWKEDQVIEMIIEDGDAMKPLQVPYSPNFSLVGQQRTQQKADVVSMYSTPEGKSMVRVKVGEKEIDLETRFVN